MFFFSKGSIPVLGPKHGYSRLSSGIKRPERKANHSPRLVPWTGISGDITALPHTSSLPAQKEFAFKVIDRGRFPLQLQESCLCESLVHKCPGPWLSCLKFWFSGSFPWRLFHIYYLYLDNSSKLSRGIRYPVCVVVILSPPSKYAEQATTSSFRNHHSPITYSFDAIPTKQWRSNCISTWFHGVFLFEKLVVPYLVKKFTTFYVIPRIITVPNTLLSN